MIVDIFDEKHLRNTIASASKKADKILFNKATMVDIRAKQRKGSKKWKSSFEYNGDNYELKVDFDERLTPTISTEVQTCHGKYRIQANVDCSLIYVYSPHFDKRCRERYRHKHNRNDVEFVVRNYKKDGEDYKVYIDDNGDLMLLKDKGDIKVFVTYLQEHMTKNVIKEVEDNKCAILDEHIEKYDLK